MVDFIAQKVGMCCALLSLRLSVCHTYRQLWRYVDFSRWQPYRRKYSFAFWFYNISPSGRQITCVSTFDLVSQSTAEILLLPVSENKRPPSWNSTSGFDFDPFIAIGMWFSIGTPNFIEIGLSAAGLWRHSDFQHGGRQPCWIWFRAMVAHPQSASRRLCFVLKFRLDRIYSFGDRAIFIFWHFGLKLPIHAHF